jgi:hypothetical protein
MPSPVAFDSLDEDGDPRVGTTLQERYRICARIAAGGMGVVYRGERLGLEKPVAIKFLHSFMAAQQDIVRRFGIEARAMSRLAHPACVSVIDFGVDGGAPYLVMDYVTGQTLRPLLEAGPLPVELALSVMRQILAGLAHAHGQGIVHRDIKPENILLSDVTGFGTQARILDFGVAKLLDASTALTSGFAIGTPSYMAPEQASGQPVDARTDVYAAGVLLFECLSGRKPFRAEQMAEVLRLQREATAPSLRSVCPASGFSAQLEAVLAKSLAKQPGDRFQSAAELAQALEATPEGAGVAPASPRADSRPAPAGELAPVSIANASPSRRSGRRAWVAAAGTVVVAVVALFAWGLSSRARPGSGPPAPAAAIASAATTSAAGSAGDEVAPEDTTAPTTATAVAAGPHDDRLPGIDHIRELIRAKRWTDAVHALEELKKQHQQEAYVPYLLGNLYFEKFWAQQGFEAYRDALRLDPAYRDDPLLIRNAIRMFISDGHAFRAEKFLRDDVGRPAIPYLEEARQSRNPVVRRRAERVLAQLH